MKKSITLQNSIKTIVFTLAIFLFRTTAFSQDTLHLNYIALQTKMPDSTDAKVAAWAKNLNGRHVDLEVLCYYSQGSFKPYATERSEEVFLVLNRKARASITIVKNEVVKGSKSQRSMVDVVYRTTGSVDVVKEKEKKEPKPKELKTEEKTTASAPKEKKKRE